MKKLALVLFATVLLSLPAHAASPDLEKVLRQLDAASTRFTSAQADFKWDQYTSGLPSNLSTDTQTGTIYFKHNGPTTQMAAQVRQLNGKDNPKTVVYDGKLLRLYQPRIHQITQFDAGKNKTQYESFLTLGFGGSGKDLEASWDIKLIGMENIGGVQVAHLVLVSKQESVRNMFSRVEIWVDPTRGVSLKQVFTAGDDSRTAYYSNIKTNIIISPANFVLDAKKLGAQTVNH
jgi:outer membrane lipoprotein-sorting protein